jgi:hypothetical protein
MLIEVLVATLLATQQPAADPAAQSAPVQALEAPAQATPEADGPAEAPEAEPRCLEEVHAVRLADESIADGLRERGAQLEKEAREGSEARVHYAVAAMVVGIVAGAFIGGGVALVAKGVGGNAVTAP